MVYYSVQMNSYIKTSPADYGLMEDFIRKICLIYPIFRLNLQPRIKVKRFF